MSADQGLAGRVGYRLKQVDAVLRGRMDAALRPFGLTTPQYACLELLRQSPGASSSDLARGAFVTRQTMNTLLVGLERRGLVARATTASVGRTLPTELTPEGHRVVAAAADLIADVEARLVTGLTPGQADELFRALGECIRALSDDPTPV